MPYNVFRNVGEDVVKHRETFPKGFPLTVNGIKGSLRHHFRFLCIIHVHVYMFFVTSPVSATYFTKVGRRNVSPVHKKDV